MSRVLYRLRAPPEIIALIRGLHPHLKKKARAALEAILSNPHAGKALKDEQGWGDEGTPTKPRPPRNVGVRTSPQPCFLPGHRWDRFSGVFTERDLWADFAAIHNITQPHSTMRPIPENTAVSILISIILYGQQ